MMIKQKLLLFILLFISFGAFGQTLIEDGQWHRVEYSGSYKGFKLSPERISDFAFIQFRVVRADGEFVDFESSDDR